MNNSLGALIEELNKYDLSHLSASDCARALRSTLGWLRESSFYSRHQQPLSTLRLKRLLDDLNNDLAFKKRLHIILSKTLESFDLSTLLTHTGLSRPHGFFQELGSRGIDKILPRHSPRPNFMDLVYFLFPIESDSGFFQKMPRDLYNQLLALFDPELKNPENGRKILAKHFSSEILDALLILSAECIVLSESGLMNDIRWTINGQKEKRNAFLDLHRFVNKTVEDRRINPIPFNNEEKENCEDTFSEIIQNCRQELSSILEHLENNSLSMDLVYKLEVLQLLVDRIRALLFIFVLNGQSGPKSLEFFAALIAEEQRRRSIRALIAQNVHYLARKIVDNAGETGDHYIARNPHETQDLFKAALGGGFLTGFTVLIKILLHHAHFALFFSGFFAALNYAGSFISMQFMHLTLATKQPAMTAASIAKRMTSLGSELKELKDELRNLLKSQMLAAAGNLCAVIPTAYCLFLVWQMLFDAPIFSPEEAKKLIATHNPLQSLTLFYALLTGVILWSSSLVHGWMQNWMIFRGIPDLLADSFLVENFLSRDRRLRLSKWLRTNLAGITANTALGVLLAFTPIIGNFFGIPLDVRHITLATGGLTLAWASVPLEDMTYWNVIGSLSGLFIILTGNIVTSFFLSLWLALRAKGWSLSDIRKVFNSRGS